MPHHLNILHLEDDRLDADRIRETLSAQGIVAEMQVVQTESAFRSAILSETVDLVLSDYYLPGFNGLSALGIVREKHPDLPFIFVSGTIGEDIAIKSLRSGATDYVPKQGLEGLGKSVRRALNDVREQERRVKQDEVDVIENRHFEEAWQNSETRHKLEVESNIRELKLAHDETFRLAAIVESSHDAIIGKSFDGIITSWNQGARKLYGYSAEEVVGTSIAILAPPEHFDAVTLLLARLRRGDSIDHFETERITKEGKRIFVSLTISPVRDESGAISGLSTIARDITKRKQAETALQTSELRYRRLFESAHDGILILEGDTGQITEVNPYLIEMLGFSKEELTGRELWEIGPFKDIVASKLAFEELQQRGYIRYEDLPLKSRDGRLRQVEFVSNSYLEGTNRVIQCNIRDITERKLAEEDLRQTNHQLEGSLVELRTKTDQLASMTEQLWQASKLATMGELAASVAHELNNPLATISLHAELLVSQLAEADPNRESLLVIEQEVGRMAALVSHLLLFARRGHRQISTINIEGELRSSLEFLNYHLRSHMISVVTAFEKDLPSIQADSQQLQQVFLNLLTNAADAMPEGGSLTVRASGGVLESGAPALVIEFSDTGIGVKAEDLPRLWEPFFTTKPEGKGTGLGLPICRRAVEEHQGTIDIESLPEKGTTIRIILPAMEG
jgi:PAS domain S-box-containing protein